MYVYSLRYVSMSTIFSEYTVSANYTQVHVFTAIALTFLVIRVCGNVIIYVFFCNFAFTIDSQQLWDHNVKLARWQHPATGHRSIFAMPPPFVLTVFNCFFL